LPYLFQGACLAGAYSWREEGELVKGAKCPELI